MVGWCETWGHLMTHVKPPLNNVVLHTSRIPAPAEALPRRGGRDLQRAAGTAATGAPALQRSAEPRVAGTGKMGWMGGKPWENHRKTIGKPWENGGFNGKTIGKP